MRKSENFNEQMTIRKRKVYIEVTNTLQTPFVTGIQRVTILLLQELMKIQSSELEYVPIVYSKAFKYWRGLTAHELEDLFVHSKERTLKRRSKYKNWVSRIFKNLWRIRTKIDFEAGTIFLDLEAAWHNQMERSVLLKELNQKNILSGFLLYDMIPISHPEFFVNAVQTKFGKYIKAHSVYSNFCFSISNFSKTEYRKYLDEQNLPQRDIEVIDLGSDHFTTCEPAVPIKKGRYILCVGTLQRRKNQGLLLSVFEQIAQSNDEVSLIFVGKKGWECDELIGKIKRSKFYNNRLYWFQNADDNILSNFYQNAFLNVLPSLIEGFGMPIIESLSYNCPTLVSLIPSHEEVGQNYVNYFKSNDFDDCRKSIEILIEDDKAYAELKKKSKSYEVSSWNDTALQVHHVLLKI